MTKIQRLVLDLRYDCSAFWLHDRPEGFQDHQRRYVRGPTAASLLEQGWITDFDGLYVITDSGIEALK